MTHLYFSTQQFVIEEINESVLSQDLSFFERAVIKLIIQWKTHQPTFSFFTSGSTGAPKQINFTREQIKTSAHLTINALGLQAHHTSLVCLDTHYIAGQLMVIRSLESGMNMVAVEPSADPLLALSTNQKIDFAALVPYQLQTILQSTSSTERLTKINNVIIGGAALDKTVQVTLQALTGNLFATYGMTETITHIALQKINGLDKQTYFQSLKGITLSLDERNCLVIEAPHFKRVVTNDLVHLLDTDKFIWLGRFDNVINSGGVKIIPEKVEAQIALAFLELNVNARFFISGLPDQKLGSRVVLIVEGETIFEKQELLELLSAKLLKYEVPKEIHFIPNFMETDTQKINRRETLKFIRS